MNNEEVRQAVKDRLSHIATVVDSFTKLTSDIAVGKHAQGVIDAIEGTNGEKEFLEKLLEEMR